MDVIKANGEIVPFDANRIRDSLRRVKTAPPLIERVVDKVSAEIYDRIPTSKLHSIVFGELRSLQKGASGRYNLKKAIFQLGPTGFPFEKLIGSLFETEGFSVATEQTIGGNCVTHEVDVVAEKKDILYHAECKFHSFQGKVCDVKHALYTDARFRDIRMKIQEGLDTKGIGYKGWLITNTRMTSDAIAYGTCAGLALLSWDYPPGDGLRERIDRSGLHPVTCLTFLSLKHKQQLLERGITLCREVTANPNVLFELGISSSKINEILDEAVDVCSPQGS